MKEIYIKKLVLFCCLFTFTSSLFAQFELSITAPTSAVASYTLVLGNGGTLPTGDISSELFSHTGLACDTIVSAGASGKITLIDRGTCGFNVKLEAARRAGSIAVVICNSTAAAPIPAEANPKVPFPVFMVSQADCQKIRTAITGGAVTGKISNKGCATPRVYDPAVFWGQNPGQGDFSNGLAGWTTKTLTDTFATWVGLPSGTPELGAFNGSTAFLPSPTFCNGVASFSFAKYQLQLNPTTVQPYATTSGELISPTIDCSGKNFIAVDFYVLNNRLNGNNSFSFSTDDGETWSEPEVLNPAHALNTTPIMQNIVLPLPAFTNQPKCKIKFIAEGDFYFFMIDDVTLTSKKIYSMEISSDYFGMAANYATPFNQAEAMPFTLDIENLGNAPVNNVKVAVRVNEVGIVEPVYTDTLMYGNVEVGVRDSDRIFAKKFTPEEKIANYVLSYNIIGDSLTPSASLTASNDFVMSKNIYSKLPINPNLVANYSFTSGNSFYSIGNYYKVVASEWPDGQPITLDKGYASATVDIDAQPAITSAILTYDVYKWIDLNQDTFFVQSNERTLLATGSVLIDDDIDTIAIELFDPLDDTKKVVLPSGEHQLVAVVSLAPIDGTNIQWTFPATSAVAGHNVGKYNSYAAALGRIFDGYPVWTGSFLAEGTADDIETRELENTSLTVYNPLILKDVELVNTVAFDASLKFKAYPVPAVQDLTVEIAFEKVQDFANILIADMSGRIVHAEKYVNVQNRNLTVDVSRFAAGVYTLQVVTETGFNSQTFSVVR